MSYHEKTAHAARGQWVGILQHLGLAPSFLSGKNGPCPMCEGVDRWRFLNKEGSGSWVCNQCRPETGTGIDLVMALTGLGFADAASRVDEIVRNEKPGHDKPKAEPSERELRTRCQSLWNESAADGDLLHRYLASRGLDIAVPAELRLHRGLATGGGHFLPCMIARVSDDQGKGVTLHRTFLRQDGRGKAEIPKPRLLMKGIDPAGGVVRLGPVASDLGIAEGIETSLAASVMFELPVWAGLSAVNMTKWRPPAGVESLTIFGDRDESFTGQATAYTLAHRIHLDRPEIHVTVRLPEIMGDWNDVLIARQRTAA